jgi:hypothetical protein
MDLIILSKIAMACFLTGKTSCTIWHKESEEGCFKGETCDSSLTGKLDELDDE